jgi:hypothetical protein
MNGRTYRAAASQQRLERLARAADLLAMLYIRGYECGLRGQHAGDWEWWEGTRAMVAAFERGNAAGLARCEASTARHSPACE